jgi:hypothetical protein
MNWISVDEATKKERFKKLEGGLSPLRIVQQFILGIGGEPLNDMCESQSEDIKAWQVSISQAMSGSGASEINLYVELETTGRSSDVIITLAMPLATVAIKNAYLTLISALEISKVLVGCRLYLQENRLWIASSLCGDLISLDVLKVHYQLLKSQRELLIKSL